MLQRERHDHAVELGQLVEKLRDQERLRQRVPRKDVAVQVDRELQDVTVQVELQPVQDQVDQAETNPGESLDPDPNETDTEAGAREGSNADAQVDERVDEQVDEQVWSNYS